MGMDFVYMDEAAEQAGWAVREEGGSRVTTPTCRDDRNPGMGSD